MRLLQYLKEEIDQSFIALEDKRIAKRFDYSRLTLKKPPKELTTIYKILKKHLKRPLEELGLRNGTQGEGGLNIAIYSESLDSMGINLTNIKKVKKGGSSTPVNFHDQLEKNKDSLEKWLVFQEKAVTPKDKKKARGSINRLHVSIRNLEDKITKGETPLPYVSHRYAKNLEEALELIVLHELGHREKNKSDLFRFQAFFNQGNFPTEYSKHNISEYHSEIYCLTKMKMIDKTPISDEAKEYFKKTIK